MADAARAYISARTDSPGDIIRVARKWSMDGWAAVARNQELDFQPWGEEMFRALALLEADVKEV